MTLLIVDANNLAHKCRHVFSLTTPTGADCSVTYGFLNVLKSYISEAIKIEESGEKVVFEKNPEPVPEELLAVFDEDPIFKRAFFELTPGRQRGYIIYFSQPKQPKTRFGRIEKYKSRILNGIGLHDRYNS